MPTYYISVAERYPDIEISNRSQYCCDEIELTEQQYRAYYRIQQAYNKMQNKLQELRFKGE